MYDINRALVHICGGIDTVYLKKEAVHSVAHAVCVMQQSAMYMYIWLLCNSTLHEVTMCVHVYMAMCVCVCWPHMLRLELMEECWVGHD